MARELARTAVITGAGSGLGRAMALTWGSRGWKIGAADIDSETAAETARLVEEKGGTAEPWLCDVSRADEVEAMAAHFFTAWGEVGLLANNAGVADVGFVGDVLLENWHRIIETSLWGVIHGCHFFVPGMKKQGAGYIVNTASAAGFMNLPEMAPYNVVKAGVISLSETLRVELAPDNIGVSVICPSFFKTNLVETMTCSDEWECDFTRTVFENARMSADSIARRVADAVEANKLYIVPQRDTKRVWRLRRAAPSLWCSGLERLYSGRGDRPALMWLARRGLL